jgi:hypothetical protein
MNSLTGNKDVDFLIIQHLNDTGLKNISVVNKYMLSLFNDPNFWLKRISTQFNMEPKDIRKTNDYYGFGCYKELYKYFRLF